MRQTESGLIIPNPISFNKQGILMEYIEFGKVLALFQKTLSFGVWIQNANFLR